MTQKKDQVLENKQTNQKKTISLIIPCFNEQENIQDCHAELTQFWKDSGLETGYDLEMVFVDDGSKDFTVMEVVKARMNDSRVVLVELSRNFGKEIAITAGLSVCTGDSAIVFNSDMQYPIEKLPEFIDKWEEGSEVVVGVRDKKKTSNIIKKLGSDMFYWIMDSISETGILRGALDYRLIDREVIDIYNEFGERKRVFRGIIDWLGFDRSYVHYTEKPRHRGTVSFNFIKRLQLALDSFIGHSLFPIKLAGYMGMVITVLSGFLGFFALITQFLFASEMEKYKIVFSGPFLLGIFNSFLTGIIMVCLGLIAAYIGNIQTEVANRPLFVIKKNRKKTEGVE